MTSASIIAARERLGLRRVAFCAALGLSRNALLHYEQGKTTIPRYIALAITALLHGLPPAE